MVQLVRTLHSGAFMWEQRILFDRPNHAVTRFCTQRKKIKLSMCLNWAPRSTYSWLLHTKT